MSKTVNFPLYDEFLKIFIDHEISNWQAKYFWEKMGLNQCYRAKRCKRLMYVGLRVLLRCQYLEIDTNNSTKKHLVILKLIGSMSSEIDIKNKNLNQFFP